MNYDNQLDLELLDRSITGYVPLNVRYGFCRISDFVRHDNYYPRPEGMLWVSRVAIAEEPVLGSQHDFEA